MNNEHDVVRDRLLKAAERAAQSKARTLLKSMRQAHREKAKSRKAQARRHAAYGEAVVIAGLGHWSMPELVGGLLEMHRRFNHSSTQRLVLKQAGEALLAQRRHVFDTERRPTHDPPT
jgi:hypothetical protein